MKHFMKLSEQMG